MLSILILLLFVFLFFFLIFPASRIHPDRAAINCAYIAHRGLHNAKEGVPENSLLSFEKAMEKGFPIEIDIHLTKDGEVVVFHDETTGRMCKTDLQIEKCTLPELKKLDLLSTDQKIPALKECLDLVNGKVFLLIEFKVVDGNTAALCEKANEILSGYDGKYLIQSFYPQVLNWYRAHRRDICRGQLSGGFKIQNPAKFLLGKQMLNFIGRPDFISYEHKFAKSIFFRLAIMLGAAPVGWTFRSKKEWEENGRYVNTWIFENFDPNSKND